MAPKGYCDMNKTKKWITNILLVVFALIFVVSAVMVVDYVIKSFQANSQKNDLLNLKNNPPHLTLEEPTKGPADATAPSGSTEPAEPGILPEYRALYEINSDLVGWVTVPGTRIDYPVMQTDRENDYYLHRDFYREYSSHGMVFAEEDADVEESDVVTIYGHNKDDGTMFGDMDEYWSYDFYKDHKVIYFDTLMHRYAYEIITVFNTTATLGEGYEYHTFIDAESELDFDRYIANVERLALYDTGVSAEYGDHLLVLSTCEYSQVNGRLVIVAKRVGEVEK